MADANCRRTGIRFITGVGVVQKFMAKHKALVKFQDVTIEDNREQMALLKTERFAYRGVILNQYEDESAHIWQFVSEGSRVRFHAHPLSTEGDKNDAQWFIMFGWLVSEEAELEISYLPALSNRDCKVTQIDPSGKRRGILTYETYQGESIDLNFLASKVMHFGKKLNSKDALKKQMHLDDTYYCEAIPQLSVDDEDGITWLVTCAKKGKSFETKEIKDSNLVPQITSDINSLEQAAKGIATNSKALFVKGKGQVLKIINEELGLALIQITNNIFETVMFNRACVIALGSSMAEQNLQDVLQEGDPLKIICTSACPGTAKNPFMFQWVACSVHLALEEPPQ